MTVTVMTTAVESKEPFEFNGLIVQYRTICNDSSALQVKNNKPDS